MRAAESSNIDTSAGGDEETPTPAPDSTVAAANLRRETPLVVVRTYTAAGPPVATAAMAATEPPRATPTKRTASETGDADEAAPPAKCDCTTSAANDRQQTYLAAFRVRPLQTSVTPSATTGQTDPPASAPQNSGTVLLTAQSLQKPNAPTPERAVPPTMPPRTAADQPVERRPPAGQLQQPPQPLSPQQEAIPGVPKAP